ncbi:MAG: transglutaminase domain-containing protein, partial [Xanthomonadales bacterium]|nr:transglutaminase domain-containing protein [Xanthomonadales bacterium]
MSHFRSHLHRALAGAFCLWSLCAPSLAQQITPAQQPLVDHAQRFSNQAQQAERGLDQGRRALQHLDRVPDELKRRQQAAEAALQQARGQAIRDLELLRLNPAATDRGSVEARNRLAAQLSRPASVQTEREQAQPQRIPLGGSRALRQARAEPGPADLAATLDAPQTAAIAAQAQALGGAPVAIFEWVRKNIDFVPSAGSLQGAAVTLASRRGNATDQASLLLALLRSAGVHARYVVGQIEVDQARLLHWFGVDRIESVTELLTEGGVAFDPVVNGGSITALRLEHVWVEAWIDLVPSRGARHRQGDAWLALDPSFKVLEQHDGLDWQTLLSLDVRSLLAAIEAAALVDRGGRFLSQLGADALAAQLQRVGLRLEDVLQAQGLQSARLSELLPAAQDASPDYPYFPGGLPYALINSQTPVSTLDDAQRHRLIWSWRSFDNGQAGTELVRLEQPTVALANAQPSVRWAPASDVDRDVLLALLPSGSTGIDALPESLPAYLIEVVPQLWLGDTLLQTGPALTLGQALQLDMELVHPAGWRTRQRDQAYAGELRGLQLNWHGGDDTLLRRSLADLRGWQGGPASATAGRDWLALAATGQQRLADLYQGWLAGLNRTWFHRQSGALSAYLQLDVEAPFGILTAVRPLGVALDDVSPPHLGSASQHGDEARFVHQSVAMQALYGQQILELLYPSSGRAAAAVLHQGLQNSVPLYRLTAADQVLLQNLALPSALAQRLGTALAAAQTAHFLAKTQ